MTEDHKGFFKKQRKTENKRGKSTFEPSNYIGKEVGCLLYDTNGYMKCSSCKMYIEHGPFVEGLRSQTIVWLRKLKFIEMHMCRQ